jgi:hypothetical protein
MKKVAVLPSVLTRSVLVAPGSVLIKKTDVGGDGASHLPSCFRAIQNFAVVENAELEIGAVVLTPVHPRRARLLALGHTVSGRCRRPSP